MTFRITTAVLVLAASPVFAQTPKLTPRPSAATPAPANTETFGPYVPYTGPKAANAPMTTHMTPVENPEDAMIVVDVPEREGELREGTLLRTRIQDTLSTDSTLPGTRFWVEGREPITGTGAGLIPV